MNIQKVSQQPSFSGRMAVKGNPGAIKKFVADLAKDFPNTEFITKGKGKFAYIAHLDDVSRLNGNKGEVAGDVFDSIAGRNPMYTDIKDLEKAIKAKMFDAGSMIINK